MMAPSMANVEAWIAQSLLVAFVGALLPVLFRIRHPRTQLAYCHLVVAICFVLPLIQPWKHPLILAAPETETAAGTTTPSWVEQAVRVVPEQSQSPAKTPAQPASVFRSVVSPTLRANLLFALLLAGVLARLCWLFAELWQTRKCRIASMPLYPIPESLRAASSITHADAVFCISSQTRGPVMLGWLAPVVLLPESFLELDEEAQCGVACHELLHVRRHDWLITVLEEIAGAMLWFNPAVWWLLAQAGLAREQLVDSEAVRLTAAREPYID
ncbi:MAG TPA: M56 family metallopeptidase, partial [Bryobacteraceae bacterium]|nr:M56 family metallopeptidase [Bryobacteraceae bacterium]